MRNISRPFQIAALTLMYSGAAAFASIAAFNLVSIAVTF